jgi:pimeloyl-ACP methyl ester carboxylesterase
MLLDIAAIFSVLTSLTTNRVWEETMIDRESTQLCQGVKSIARYRFIVLAGAMLLGILAMPMSASAQDVSDLQTANSPLVLKAQGTFFVGGDSVLQTTTEVGGFNLFPGGHITINQMYVQYMIPQGHGNNKVPVVMVHGGTLSGKSWETTPDGRMGWDEYFVRNGYPVYKPDQVSRARSGFNQAVFNDVRAGIDPPASLPLVSRLSDEIAWTLFRWGPAYGTAYPDEQFPVEAAAKFSKQGIPDFNGGLTPQQMSALATQLNGAVLMGHSESGLMPERAMLISSTGIKGLITIEPGGSCNSTGWTDQQIATLATVPILLVFGDHLSTSPVNYIVGIADCQAFANRLNGAGGHATLIHLPDLGIHGNSHMMMLDKNNLQVADVFLKWLDQNVH